jgi:hypothetical protein
MSRVRIHKNLVVYLPEEKLNTKIDDITNWFPSLSHIIHQQVAHRGHDSLYNKTRTDKNKYEKLHTKFL